jgi:hypothetical protein
MSFDSGLSTIALVPRDYVLDTRLQDGPGDYLNRTTEMSVTFSILPRAVEIDVDPWRPAQSVRPDSNDTIYVAVPGSDPATGDARNFDVDQIYPAAAVE